VKYPVGHTAVLLIMQYARMTQCTTVLPGDVQLALWYLPLDPPWILLDTRLVLETRLLLEEIWYAIKFVGR